MHGMLNGKIVGLAQQKNHVPEESSNTNNADEKILTPVKESKVEDKDENKVELSRLTEAAEDRELPHDDAKQSVADNLAGESPDPTPKRYEAFSFDYYAKILSP